MSRLRQLRRSRSADGCSSAAAEALYRRSASPPVEPPTRSQLTALAFRACHSSAGFGTTSS